MTYKFDFSFLAERWPAFLEGAWLTIQLTVVAIVLGFIVGTLCAVLRVYGGGVVPEQAFTALTDTRFYGLNYNIPSLCFGASGEAMHGFNEYVDLESLRKSTKATALFIAEWCGVEAV